MDSFSPGFQFAGGDGRFGDVVEDEGLVGEFLDELNGSGELFGENENVVGEVELFQFRDAAEDVGAHVEAVVWFVLGDVADADEFGMFGEGGEVLFDVVGAEIDPADDAFDEFVLVGEFEEPAAFFDGLTGLDGDAAVELGGGEEGLEVGREEITAEAGEFVCHPRVLRGVVLPEVLVCIEAHEFEF